MNNFLAITYAFMLGFCPYDDIGSNKTFEHFENATHVQFELGIDVFNCVKVCAGEETLQTMDENLFNWYPYTQNYFVGMEFHKELDERLSIAGGIKHNCQHPLNAWDKQCSTFDSSRTELYIKVSGKINVF